MFNFISNLFTPKQPPTIDKLEADHIINQVKTSLATCTSQELRLHFQKLEAFMRLEGLASQQKKSIEVSAGGVTLGVTYCPRAGYVINRYIRG